MKIRLPATPRKKARDYAGRWVAGFSQVGNTEMIVVVQQRYAKRNRPAKNSGSAFHRSVGGALPCCGCLDGGNCHAASTDWRSQFDNGGTQPRSRFLPGWRFFDRFLRPGSRFELAEDGIIHKFRSEKASWNSPFASAPCFSPRVEFGIDRPVNTPDQHATLREGRFFGQRIAKPDERTSWLTHLHSSLFICYANLGHLAQLLIQRWRKTTCNDSSNRRL